MTALTTKNTNTTETILTAIRELDYLTSLYTFSPEELQTAGLDPTKLKKAALSLYLMAGEKPQKVAAEDPTLEAIRALSYLTSTYVFSLEEFKRSGLTTAQLGNALDSLNSMVEQM